MLNFMDPTKNCTTDIIFVGLDFQNNLYHSTDLLYYNNIATSKLFQNLKWKQLYAGTEFESLNCSSHKVMIQNTETIHCYAKPLHKPQILIFNVTTVWSATNTTREAHFAFHGAYELPHNFTADKVEVVSGLYLLVGGSLHTDKQHVSLQLFYELREPIAEQTPKQTYGVSASLLKTYSMEHYYGSPNSKLMVPQKPDTLVDLEQELLAVSFEVTCERNQSTQRLMLMSSDGTANTANVYFVHKDFQLTLSNHKNGTKLNQRSLSKMLSEYQLVVNFEHTVDLAPPPPEPVPDNTLLRAAVILGIICTAICLGTCIVYIKVKRDQNSQDDRVSAIHRDTSGTFYSAWPRDLVSEED